MALRYTEPTPAALLDPQQLATHLLDVVTAAERRLRPITEQAATEPTTIGKWSPKQVLGHLLDSAANNWQRFVRLQLQASIDLPGYEQDGWVRVQHYHERPWQELIAVWVALNHHLAHVIAHTERSALANVWRFGSDDLTLGFIIEDYIAHIEHHLRQISS